jgi:hypothetical protein
LKEKRLFAPPENLEKMLYATFGLISVWGQLCAISFSPAGGKVLGFGYRTKA